MSIEQYRKRFFNLLESTIGDVKPLIGEQNNPSPSATTEVCQTVPQPIEGLESYLFRNEVNSQYDDKATNMIELPDGTYSFVEAELPNNTKRYGWVYVIDSKQCWTGYLLGIGSREGPGKFRYDPSTLTLNISNTSPEITDGVDIGAVHMWKQNKYPKSTIKGITIREQSESGTTQVTTIDSVLNDFIQKGYKDITDWYFSPEGVVYIPDGDYVGNGWGYYENVLTKDNKDTGYVLILKVAVKGNRNDTVKVDKNGSGIGSTGGKIDKILLNDKILDSSGLRKK